jgi:hypothetical protein
MHGKTPLKRAANEIFSKNVETIRAGTAPSGRRWRLTEDKTIALRWVSIRLMVKPDSFYITSNNDRPHNYGFKMHGRGKKTVKRPIIPGTKLPKKWQEHIEKIFKTYAMSLVGKRGNVK